MVIIFKLPVLSPIPTLIHCTMTMVMSRRSWLTQSLLELLSSLIKIITSRVTAGDWDLNKFSAMFLDTTGSQTDLKAL